MKDLRPRLVIISVLTVLAAWAVSDQHKFKLGQDLSGGTTLIYRVNVGNDAAALNMDKLLPALKERLDPAGLYNFVIRALGTDRVEIIIPEAQSDDVEAVKRSVSTVGQLQFKIVANKRRHSDLIERAKVTWPNRLVGQEGVFVPFGVWLPVDRNIPANGPLLAEAEKAWPSVTFPGGRWIPVHNLVNAQVDDKTNLVKQGEDGQRFVLAQWDNDGIIVDNERNMVREDADGSHFVLMFNDDYNVTGEFLTRVDPTIYEGNAAVSFNFNSEGARRFSELTGEYKPDPTDQYRSQLGVILDNRLRSAPSLNARIGSSGVITGRFSKEEVDELVKILNAGQLPYALEKEPSSEFQIAATLGSDTIRNGVLSIALALGTIIVFMLVYYGLAGGGVAVIALALNLLLTVALMVIFKATWTLPGLAGLVLTVGMAVDANVLIFERMREELNRGVSLGMALRLGYDKAWSTILDSNLTTILTAVILFMIGTDQVKGFAITLILGLLTSMFCAVWVTRAIFDLLYTRRLISRLRMLNIIGETNIDFLAPWRACVVGSILFISIGLVAIAMRGKHNFDVDFTGGTMVGLHVKEPMPTAEVRRLASSVLPDIAVEDVRLSGEPSGERFVLRTTQQDSESTPKDQTVRALVSKAFADHLVMTNVNAGPIESIPARGAEDATSPLAAFAGGNKTTLSFEPPVRADFVRGHLDSTLTESNPNVPNVADLYALIPEGEGTRALGGASDELEYSKFLLGTRQELDSMVAQLKSSIASSPEFDQFNQFGPQVAGETQNRALFAVALSWLGIIAYVWLRFGSWAFGVAGVVALVHDVLVATGVMAMVSLLAAAVPGLSVLSLSEMKIDLNSVAAILTLIGFSINDTIVIFDRIRELRGKSPSISSALINRSLNQTLSRTIITSLTVLIVSLILYFGAGVALRGFSFILVVGVLTGTYSTIYIASPVLLWLANAQLEKKSRTKSTTAAAL